MIFFCRILFRILDCDTDFLQKLYLILLPPDSRRIFLFIKCRFRREQNENRTSEYL